MINHYASYTIGQLKFTEDSSKSGKLIKANFKDSYWTKTENITDTDTDNNFFSVHYEINKQDPNKVMFHIESPPQKLNPDLNLIKRLLILSITADLSLSVINSQIKTSLAPLGCKIEIGKKNDSYNSNSINHKPDNIEKNISTTVFTIQFTQPIIPSLTYDYDDQFKLPNDEKLDFKLKIKEVHRNLANIIDKFLILLISLLSIH
jgi:hypothetical protein